MGSLFDGIGGFPLAAQLVGIKPVWSCEIEKIPKKITAERFPDMLQYGDIRKLKGEELPPVWMIAGGSPCQDLSIAGDRKGLSGDRSGLFMEQIRIVKEMRDADRKRGRTALSVRPRWMCWENVPGAFSSTEGKDFQTVLQEIARVADSSVSILEPPDGKWKFAGEVLGDSFSIAWRVLDAEFFGVAQRRNRVFLIADFAGPSAPQILFKSESLPGYTQPSPASWERIAAAAGSGLADSGGLQELDTAGGNGTEVLSE